MIMKQTKFKKYSGLLCEEVLEWVWSHNLHKGRAIQRAHYPLNHYYKEQDNSYFLAALAASLVHFKSIVHPALGFASHVFLIIFYGSSVQFQDPPSGFTFTTLHSSGTLSLFTNSHDVAYRRIGRNMMPHLVKNYTEGLDKLKSGSVASDLCLNR